MASEHDLEETLDSVFDFKLLSGTEANNIDNEFHLTVLKGNKGERIGRMSINALNADYIDVHPNSNKLMKSLHCWFWFAGAIKTYSDFRGQGISLADKRVYLTLSPGHPEVENIVDSYPPAEIIPEQIMGYEGTDEDGNIWGISDESLDACKETYGSLYWKDQAIPEWTKTVMEWEWKVDHSYIEAIEDDTILVCLLPIESRWRAKWEVESIIITPGDTKTTLKKGTPCYLFSGGPCEVTDTVNNITHQFETWDCKKLTKENYTVKNTGSEKLKLLRFYKNV